MSTIELKKALHSIAFRIHNFGDGHQRYNLNDILIDFTVDTYGELDYKIKEINGQMCYVYRSKL